MNISENFISSLNQNSSVKLLDINDSVIIADVSTVSNNSFIATTNEQNIKTYSTNLFLYGKKVDDFLALKKEYLFTLNFAATQQIDRILQSTNQRVQLLENLVQSQQSTINSILSRI